jgi:hypothetical protein
LRILVRYAPNIYIFEEGKVNKLTPDTQRIVECN